MNANRGDGAHHMRIGALATFLAIDLATCR